MQVTETLNEGLKRSYRIVITAAALDDKVNEKLVEAQPGFEMNGFRKGKVPMTLLKKQFGQRLLGEAMQDSIDDAANRHFEDSGDRPALRPVIRMTNEDWKEGDDVHVEMSYEALPEIPEVALGDIALERLVVKAEDAAVEEALQSLASTAKDFEARDEGAAAEDGDQVVIDFVGKIDGEAFEDGSAEDYPLILGSGSLMPRVEEQLVGTRAGDKKDVTVTFPEDYQTDTLAGKEVVFSCTIKKVEAPVAAKGDDELARKFGAEDLDALKGQITDRLEDEYAKAARSVLKRGLLDKLNETVRFDLPPSLVKTEADQIARYLWQEENPDDEGEPPAEIIPTDAHTSLAERRVRLGLLLAELGEKAGIEVSDAEFGQAVLNHSRQYPGREREFIEFMLENKQMKQQIRAPLFEDKVIDYIFELAQVSERSVSKEELQKALEELEDA